MSQTSVRTINHVTKAIVLKSLKRELKKKLKKISFTKKLAPLSLFPRIFGDNVPKNTDLAYECQPQRNLPVAK